MTHTPTINFKRGDSFLLDITVTDPNSVDALAAQVVLTAAEVAYQAALDANPQVPQDIIDTAAAVVTAQDAYNLEIIVDITGWTITSSLRWCGKLITDFVVNIVTAAAGTLTISATDTVSALWQERAHKMDIRFLDTSNVTSSETIIVDVERGPTNG